MAIAIFITCDGCGNFIRPGERVSSVGFGRYAGVEGDSIVIEDESSVVRYCEDCSQTASDSLSGLIGFYEEATAAEEDKQPGETEDEPELTCSGGVCCPSCGDGECCYGFPQPAQPEAPEDYLGFGVTKAQYRQAVENLDLGQHVVSTDDDTNPCQRYVCSFAGSIQRELYRLGYKD